jgi:hypothetical protein
MNSDNSYNRLINGLSFAWKTLRKFGFHFVFILYDEYSEKHIGWNVHSENGKNKK